jgi:hypothetical protein
MARTNSQERGFDKAELKRKRKRLKELYSDVRWAEKIDQMPNSEVEALYLRLKNQGKV